MPRQRMVKPEFFLHRDIQRAELHHNLPLRVSYIGLWTQADREGRFPWKPDMLGVQILPYDGIDFDRVLTALEKEGFIRSYIVDGRKFGLIPSFQQHQHVHVSEAPSKLPPPPPVRTRKKHGGGTVVTRSNHGVTTSDTDTASNTDTDNVPLDVATFNTAMAHYPKRPGNSRARALRAWQARVNEGESPERLLEGVRAYAGYVEREHTPPRFIKLAATFFGPDKPYLDDYGGGDEPVPTSYEADGVTYTPEYKAYLARHNLPVPA